MENIFRAIDQIEEERFHVIDFGFEDRFILSKFIKMKYAVCFAEGRALAKDWQKEYEALLEEERLSDNLFWEETMAV